MLSSFFFLVCVYIYITYQIKKCVYNKKACVYVYAGGCFDKYISAATWPPQIKILGSAPRDEGMRDPKLGDNVFPEKFLSVHVFDVCQRFSFDPLGKIVYTDQQISLVTCCFGKGTNNIQTPLCKRPRTR